MMSQVVGMSSPALRIHGRDICLYDRRGIDTTKNGDDDDDNFRPVLRSMDIKDLVQLMRMLGCTEKADLVHAFATRLVLNIKKQESSLRNKLKAMPVEQLIQLLQVTGRDDSDIIPASKKLVIDSLVRQWTS